MVGLHNFSLIWLEIFSHYLETIPRNQMPTSDSKHFNFFSCIYEKEQFLFLFFLKKKKKRETLKKWQSILPRRKLCAIVSFTTCIRSRNDSREIIRVTATSSLSILIWISIPCPGSSSYIKGTFKWFSHGDKA